MGRRLRSFQIQRADLYEPLEKQYVLGARRTCSLKEYCSSRSSPLRRNSSVSFLSLVRQNGSSAFSRCPSVIRSVAGRQWTALVVPQGSAYAGELMAEWRRKGGFMERAERYYGRVFLVVTALLVLATAIGLRLSSRTSLALWVGGVAILGLPQTALDPPVARKVLSAYRAYSNPLFYGIYVGLVLSYAVLWAELPDAGAPGISYDCGISLRQ